LCVSVVGCVPLVIWFILADGNYLRNLATRGIEHRN
jgi:hypothetical protein